MSSEIEKAGIAGFYSEERKPPFWPPKDNREEALNYLFSAIENMAECRAKNTNEMEHWLKYKWNYNCVGLGIAVRAVDIATGRYKPNQRPTSKTTTP